MAEIKAPIITEEVVLGKHRINHEELVPRKSATKTLGQKQLLLVGRASRHHGEEGKRRRGRK